MSLLKVAGTTATSGQLYVDSVFSTYLYTGNGSTQTITNGIDLAGKGGLVWRKGRAGTYSADWHSLVDTARGATKALFSNTTDAEITGGVAWPLTSFNADGFTIPQGEPGGGQPAGYPLNFLNTTYASWTFRKAAKFFDVVTFTGNSGVQNIAHSLGVAPGMIIVKNLSSSIYNWAVYHRSLGNNSSLKLNTTDAAVSPISWWDTTDPTSTHFTVGPNSNVNGSAQYVAYLFAHDTSSTGIIQCGTYTGSGGVDTVTLGWEPQYILMKGATGVGQPWLVFDTLRGMSLTNDYYLKPNTSDAEASYGSSYVAPTATGFTVQPGFYGTGAQVIYMAIRMPNKPPTSGTQVFSPQIWTGNATARTITGTNNPVDLSIVTVRDNGGSGGDRLWNDRLRGAYQTLYSNYTSAEATQSNYITGFDVQYGEKIGTAASVNGSSITYVAEMFSRAPGFFDVVCYTGTGVNATQAHNLTVVPELMIIKNRSTDSGGGDWFVFHTFTSSNFKKQLLDTTDAQTNYTYGSFLLSQPTNSSFSLTTGIGCNENLVTYVAYLFATLAGISKVGSYTGNGSTQNIDCGFAAGARFIMIKATSTTGNWIVFDSARGIVAGNDPFFYMNNQDAEITNQDAIDPYSAGFTVNTTNVNDSGVSYIFLAVA
jgi:hypothetical protein